MFFLQKRGISIFLTALTALLGNALDAKNDQEKVEETLKLINKPYSDFFRGTGETYKIDSGVWKKTQELLQKEDDKELGSLDTRINELKQKRNSLRQERKKHNDELSRIKVQLERLEEKLQNAKQNNADTSEIEKEIKELEKSAEEPTAKSSGLKRELDGDSSFDMAVATERLELLQDSLDSAAISELEKARLKVEISRLETTIEAATGLNRRIRNVEREKYLVEARNSHKFSKLQSLKSWPGKLKKIRDTITKGKQSERKYGNVEEIGDLEKRNMRKVKVIKILPGMFSQESEIKMGRELAQEVLRSVKIHKNEVVTEYVNRLGQNLVRNSDAWCPFTFYTIADPSDTRELNAFALPGGQVFVHDTLILGMKSEGELAAVLAHETAHVTSRHAAKMLSKNQYMQIGALAGIMFGGVGYWGYQGIGMLMNIGMLGITRESESEADLLGTQYLWKSGYDPKLLEESFDRLLRYQKLGGSSFWRTHPSLDDRMERVEEEARYLPPQAQYRIGGEEFLAVQQAIRDARVDINKERKEEKDKERKKTLRREGEGSGKGEEPETPPILRRRAPQDKIPQDPPETEKKDDNERPVLKRKGWNFECRISNIEYGTIKAKSPKGAFIIR